jgi:hypothetical protein
MARFGPVLAPAGWGLLTFAVFFHYAQFIDKVAWNAIELIIAQKLGEHGVYATSLDYASAIAWRPVLPTLVVAFFQLWTEDPILIYQLVCGLSFASLVVAMFRSGRLLGNALTGHLAAFGAVSCPAVTTFLVHHFHSYSHIVTLGFLGPAIQASLSLLIAVESRPAPPLRRYLGVGLWWGLAYLCRSELLLFFGGFLIILAWRTWRGRSRFGPLLGTLGMFLLCFVPYNAYAAQATARDGILIRKTIYGFYMSQGWADPPADATADTEADGYTYAIKLYGDPKENGESLARAILRNPSAFQRRVGLNARRFYALYFDGKFIAPWLTGSALVLLLAAGVLDARRRPLAIFLLGLFVATHAILVFHVDARYLTIAVPALILGAVMLVHVVLCWVRRRLPALPVWALGGLVLAGVAWSAWWQLRTLWPGGQPGGTGPAAMKVLGEHFRSTVKQPRLAANAEPHIALLLPAPSPVAPEDVFLLPYFSHTAWVNRGAEGKFPRGRFYSFRDVEDDYVYAPAELRQAAQFQKARLVSEFQHPLLGPYLLYEMHP